jgi:cytidylate kinase
MAIITISRQVGSLGDEIAQGLATECGYRLLTPHDFQEAAARYDPDLSARLEHFFKDEGPGFFERFFFSSAVYQSLYEALVFELAARRRVVIVGRGAQIVLRDIKQVFRVRVVAPTHRRVLYLSGAHGVSADEALEYLRKHDHRRDALIRQIYAKDPDHWRLYDMILNTGRLDVAAGVRSIRAAVEEIMRLYPMEEAPPVLLGMALGKRVEAKLRMEPHAWREVEVLGQPDGGVILRGTVSSQQDSRRAAELAASQPGVTGVVNELRYAVFGYGN